MDDQGLRPVRRRVSQPAGLPRPGGHAVRLTFVQADPPTVRDIWTKGDQVVVHWDGEGMARDGRPYRNSYIWIFKMRGQQASEVTAFLDLVPYDDVLRRIPGR